ncbi:MAG TPA: ATP-binding cassette domain-containing protein [Bdellovibrionales bacterium]|nr:ATP-binding cassette domain-containing protein [Bdellovibrionales bacterium]
MRSTSTSEAAPVLSVEKLYLKLHVETFQTASWRDKFVRFAGDPLHALTKQKDRLPLIENLSLSVHEGERVGILGVNGVGKTSFCRCVAGMYKPTSGRIHVAGQVRAIFNTQVGIMPELTGRENAELLGEFLFPFEPNLKELIEEALEFSELGHFKDVPYRLYSNGMQARLNLSLISARPSRLLILDEVFDGADAFFRRKIAARVTSMIEKSGAVLFVSHDAEQIMKVCNRAIVLHGGTLAFDGAPVEALRFYESLTPTGASPRLNSMMV